MSGSSKYRWRGIGRKILLTVLLLALAGIFLYGDRGLYRWYKLRQLRDTMKVHNDSLKITNDKLSERIKALEKGDSLELEKVAREWGMLHPGEEIYLIKEEKDTVKTTPQK
ncbi:MAG: septum formation initiator family protein [bacterium]|nr:septum formation initiator family protein [bacterium]